jgi:tRNA-specific 2-thiouridylase
MDMKKKLNDAYNPDKQSRKERVVIALSGGIDSYVMAYLLKIQKYELIAVTVLNSWEDYAGDSEKVFACHITQAKIDKIKEFCHKMGIPHHILKITAEFKESVVEPWMADKVSGKFPKPCWNCHELRMKLIHDKMKELDAKHVATGHLAKLFHNDTHGTVFVHSSNDEHHDQSALLSRLSHDILSSLILPLSDLSKKEVLKLAENFGLTEAPREINIHECLKPQDELLQTLAKKVPPKFLKDGDITNIENNENRGQHEGVYHHTLGEMIEYRESGRPVKYIFSQYSYPDKRMITVEPEYLQRDKVLLVKCRLSEEVSWSEPVKGFLCLRHDEYVECWIHPKTLSSFFLELNENHQLLNGQLISVFKKKGKNSKVYLTGEIQLLKFESKPSEGEEQSVPKVNHAVDF